jgi:hypothetical protein
LRLTIRNGEGRFAGGTERYDLHSGPYGACPVVHHTAAYSHKWIWCDYRNRYGNKWYYVRDEASNIKGWIWEGELSDIDKNWHHYDDDGDGYYERNVCG